MRCPKCTQALTYEATATRIECPKCADQFDVNGDWPVAPTPPNSPAGMPMAGAPPFDMTSFTVAAMQQQVRSARTLIAVVSHLQ
jgi:hypothetical protein